MTTTIETFTHAETRFTGIKRFAQMVPAGLAVALLLVLGMQRLIHTEPVDVPATSAWVVPNPILDAREPEPIIRERPERPEPPEPQPVMPKLRLQVEGEPSDVARFMPPPAKAPAPTLGGYASDAPIATVIVQPQYPARALGRGIEGYVDVRFDVSATGATFNIRIIAAEPANVFENAALKAVQNWKFHPVTVEGKGQVYAGMEQRITFQLES